MYKIIVDKKMPKTCYECGLYYIAGDDFSPYLSTAKCRITGEIIGWTHEAKEVLPKWCPIEGSVPKEVPVQSEEEKREIERKNREALDRIAREWGL